MYRLMTLSILPLLVGGCISGGSVAPGTLPRGADAGIYTSVDAQSVATCIATALGTTPEAQGDRIVVAAPGGSGPRYSVGPNGKGVYQTQIAIFGAEQDSAQATRVQACFAPPAVG